MAVGTCQVLPNALLRWYSVGSFVMLVVCEPENPIICSRMVAGARPAVPWQDVTKYLVWYCHGANSFVRAGGGRPLASGAGVVRQSKSPWFCITVGAEWVAVVISG